MDEESLNEEQKKQERKEILKEIGPTYYEIVGLEVEEEGIVKFIDKEIKEIDAEIARLEKSDNQSAARVYIQKYGQYKTLLYNMLYSYNKEKDIDFLISEMALYKRGIYTEERRYARKALEKEKNGDNNPTIIKELEDEIIKIEEKIEILSILGNREKRAAYDAELEKKIAEVKEQRKKAEIARLEKEKRDKLRKNRLLRKSTSREIIEEELGEDFNPDRSGEKFTDKEYSTETPENPLASWKVELYPEKKLLFETQTNNKRYPELNQKVSVYRYGTFEFQTLFNNGKPTIEDKTCEIIGVKKVDIEGNIEENFLIARTMETARMEKMTMREVLELRKKGIKVTVTESEEEVRRKERKAQRERAREAKRGKIEKVLLKVKKSIIPETPKEEEIDLDAEKEVLVFEKRIVSLNPEEKEKLCRIYLSDYLIDNAVQNNSRYIGSLKHPDYDLDADVIRAAAYAEKRPGVVVDKLFSYGSELKTTADNINHVFNIIRNREKNRSAKNNTPTHTPEGKVIRFPSLDD